MLRDKFASFTMVLAIAFLLLISMIVSAVLSAVTAYFSYLLPGADFLWHIADLVVSFGVVTLLFALLFRYVPDERITWRDVWIGAAATALLFDVGKFLIGFYIGQSSVGFYVWSCRIDRRHSGVGLLLFSACLSRSRIYSRLCETTRLEIYRYPGETSRLARSKSRLP